MATNARTFRLFVSSTFADLEAERNLLQETVFPRLQRLCLAAGCRFQAVDLRWGISEEAALDQQTMRICLEEIERCKRVTARPNFVILLGDRYGWLPPPAEIPADEWATLLARMPPSERALVEAWYEVDANDLPPRYHLRPRAGAASGAAAWAPIEARLQAALAAAADAIADQQRRLAYQGSATEQEVVAGALGADDTAGRVFGFYRTITAPPADGSAARFVEQRPPTRRRLEALKATLRRALPGGVHEYAARWTGHGPSGAHLHDLAEDVYATLAGAITAELELAGPFDLHVQEQAAHRAFAEERSRYFTGRAEELRRLHEYVTGASRRPLVVVGEPGSGKSALLARAAAQTSRLHPDAEVVARFVGATPAASMGRTLLEDLCRQVARRYGQDEAAVPRTYAELVAELVRYLGLATAERPLVVLLDGLDQLAEGSRVDHLRWLPAQLPAGARLVVSTRPGEAAARVLGRRPDALTLRPMPPADGGRLLDAWLAAAGRTLQPAQRRQVLRRFATEGRPLWLRLAAEEARRWASNEDPAELPADIGGIIRQRLLARVASEEQHGAVLAGHALGYLAASRQGLAEDELLELLSADPEVMADFRRRSPNSPAVTRLPAVLWSRLRFDLEPYLSEGGGDGARLLGFYHRELAEAAAGAYLHGGDRARRHQAMAGYFRRQADPDGEGSWTGVDLRGLAELPYHLTHAARFSELYDVLADFRFLQQKALRVGVVEQPGDEGEPVTTYRGVIELLDDLELAARAWPADATDERPAVLGAVHRALRHEAYVLMERPDLLWQQVHNRLQWAGAPVRDLLDRERERRQPPGPEWLRTRIPPSESPALIRTLAGHDGPVLDCATSPDGTWICSAGIDGELRLWEVDDGIQTALLRGHGERVHACAISPDGTWIVSAGGDGAVMLWDAATGAQLATMHGHDGPVYACASSPDGVRIVSAGEDRTLRVWDVATGAELDTLRGHAEPVFACAFAPDGSWVVSAATDRTLKLWDTGSWAERATLTGHADGVQCCAVSPDGAWIVSGGYEDVLRVWNAATGEQHTALRGHTAWIEDCRFRADGALLLSASRDGTLKSWDTRSWTERATLAGHAEWVNGAAFVPGGATVVSAGADGTLKLWDLAAAGETNLSRHTSYVNQCAIGPDGSFVVSAGWDGALKLWDAASGRQRLAVAADPVSVETCAVSPDGGWVASGGRDGSVKLWDTATGRLRATMTGHTDWVLDCAVSPDGSFVVSAGRDGLLNVWDTAAGTALATLVGHDSFVSACAVGPAGTWIVSGSWDGLLKLWDPRSGAELGTLAGHTGIVSRCAVGPDGSWMVSACEDGTLRIWDVAARRERAVLAGHEGGVHDCAVSPDGAWVVSASADRTLKLWEVATGHERATLRGHTGGVMRCAVMLDGRRVVSGDNDGVVCVWDPASGRQTAHLPVGAYIPCLDAHPHLPMVAVGTTGGDVQLAELWLAMKSR